MNEVFWSCNQSYIRAFHTSNSIFCIPASGNPIPVFSSPLYFGPRSVLWLLLVVPNEEQPVVIK